MKELTKFAKGIIGTVLILFGFGGGVVMDQDQIDHAYVCSVNEKVGIFDRLSDTAKTGYYLNMEGEEKYNVCRGGTWINFKKYAKDHGIDPSLLFSSTLNKNVGSADQYLCSSDPYGCEPIQ